MPAPRLARTALLTGLTLIAFASNSILCRAALADGAIDPASFTALRLLSGAIALLPVVASRAGSIQWHLGQAVALVVYAVAFSFAYVTLDAGTGALLLFGFVQFTMLCVGWTRGERPSVSRLLGVFAALIGIVCLVAPGVSAPDPWGAALMAGSGVAWGAYSLLGRGAALPAVATARNFLMAAPVGALLLVVTTERSLSPNGIALAVASGAVTSGLGYVLWYAALRGHTRTSAAAVQLLVPMIAGAGGVLLLGEALTLRLVLSALLTLGGVGLAIRPARPSPSGLDRMG